MTTPIKATFSSLTPEAKLFKEIIIQKPKWWDLFRNDTELYIEIRKDNYINVYFNGNSVAKIHYENDFIATTHQKYLGDPIARKQDKQGKNVYEYDKIDLFNFDENTISDMKKIMSNEEIINNKEKLPEKWIQGKMIKENLNYIDSEFAYNKDYEISNLRIDLIELSNGILSFVELKRISDSRLRNDSKRNPTPPEIIGQMNKYFSFIDKYENELLEHYKILIGIKYSLGLISNSNTNFKINKTPKLIIADTYVRRPKERIKRISDIKDLLANNNIDFEIIICN